ncbi:MAG: hypothetical protein K2L07_02475 [Lachnospiraceae bacterium]|nr:hypothetical protein [Lachnospiraceae bacterium]
MMKKTVKTTVLYDAIFPIWLLWIFPITWLVVLPANFLIDLVVLVLVMGYYKIPNRKYQAKKSILRIWLCGLGADFIGALGMILAELIYIRNSAFGEWWYYNIIDPVAYNPFGSIWSFLWVTVCVLISGYFIYLFNYKFCLKKTELTQEQRKKVALAMAVFTAPYTFYLPSDIIYNYLDALCFHIV